MATAGSSQRPACPPCPAASRYPSRSGAGLVPSPPEHGEKFSARVEGRPGCSPPSGHPAHPPSPTQRHICSGERLPRRSDPETSSTRPARKDCDSRRVTAEGPVLQTRLGSASGKFRSSPKCPPNQSLRSQTGSPGPSPVKAPGGPLSNGDPSSSPAGKHKLLLEERDEMKRRSLACPADEEPGVLSDSENEEPISGRTQNMSAFVRKPKGWSGLSGSQRSQSCTNATEDQGRRWRSAAHPPPQQQGAVAHSFAAGILLSSENSALAGAAERRPSWRAAPGSSAAALGLSLPKPERSVSPDSNDSISEEFNHFKPIVCSPCTPPKRLPDGRLLEPTIVKSTPRNLSRGLQKATSYEASPAVLQRWRQIEVDRQSIGVNSKATLTSPGIDGGSAAGRRGDRPATGNKRKLTFSTAAADCDSFQKRPAKVQVPAARFSEAPLRAGSHFEAKLGVPGSCAGTLMLGRKQSPYSRNHGCHACKLVPKDAPSPWKQSSCSRHQPASQRGRKREQKTKHLDPGQGQGQGAGQPRHSGRDRAVALKLQRRFGLDSIGDGRSGGAAYCLRSWMSSQNRRRYSLRSSQRLRQKLS